MKNIRITDNNEYLYPATKDENIIRKENNFIKKLYTGLLVNGDVNTSTSAITSNSHRVVMRDNIVLPYMGVTLQFKLPENIRAKIYTSDDFMKMSSTNSDTNKTSYGWFKNGDTWTAKKEVNVNTGNKWQTGVLSEMQYRIVFAKFNDSTESTKSLSVSEIQTLIDEEKILITYRDYSDSIITRNYANEANIRWAFTDRNTSGQPYTKRLPAFAHVSDLHGDYYRWKNCMEYCNYLGIQAVVVSGDILSQNTNDGYNWFMDVQKEYPNVKVLAVAGNHDHDGDTKYWNKEMLPAIAELQKYDDYDQETGNWYTYVESINTHFIGLDLYRGGSFKPSINDSDLQYLKSYINKIVSNGIKTNLVVVTHSSETVPSRLKDDYDDWYSDMYTDDYMTQFSTYGSETKLCSLLEEHVDSDDNSILTLRGLLTGHLHRNSLGCEYFGSNGSLFEFKATIDNAISCNQRDSINGDGYGTAQDNFSIYGFTDDYTRISRVGSVITTGGKVQDRVQIDKYGRLSKPWNTQYILLRSTYELDGDSNSGTFTIISNNVEEAFDEKNKNVPKFLEIEEWQNIVPLTLINENEHLDGFTFDVSSDGKITGFKFELWEGNSSGNIIPIGRYAFNTLPKLTIKEDYTLSGYDSWNYSEMFMGCYEKMVYIDFNGLDSYILFSIIKTKTGISLRSNDFLLNKKDYYITGECINNKFSLSLNSVYQKPSNGIPSSDLSPELQEEINASSINSKLYTLIKSSDDLSKLKTENQNFLILNTITVNGTYPVGKGSSLIFANSKDSGFVGKFTGSGTIGLNNTVINALPNQQIFDTTLKFSGFWGNAEIYPEWWGAVGDGETDDSAAINAAIAWSGHTKVKLCAEKYFVASTINAYEVATDEEQTYNAQYGYSSSSGTVSNVRRQLEIMHDIIGAKTLEGAVIRFCTVGADLIIHGAIVVQSPSDNAIGVSMLGGSESSMGVNDNGTDGGIFYIDSIMHGHDSFPAPYQTYSTADTTTYGLGKGTGIIFSGIKSKVTINSIFGFNRGIWLSYVQSSTIEVTAMGNINDVYIGLLDGQKYGKSVTRNDIRIGYHKLNKNWNWVSTNTNPIALFTITNGIEVACNNFHIGSNNTTEAYYYDYIIYANETATNYLGNTFDIAMTMVAPSGRTNWKPIYCNQEKFSYSCNGNYYNNRIAWGYKHIAACKEYNTKISPVIIKGGAYTTIYRYGNNNAADSFLCDVIVTTPNAPLLTSGSTDEAIRIIVPHPTMTDRIHWTDAFPTDTSGNLIGTSFEKGQLYVAENEKTGSFYNCYAWEDGIFKKVGVFEKPKVEESDLSTDLQKKVREISPKEALFIDLWNDVTKPFNGKYNEDTGYYEMNGLTDITYDEAVEIYNYKVCLVSNSINYNKVGTLKLLRTYIFTNVNISQVTTLQMGFIGNKTVEVLDMANMYINGDYIWNSNSNLVKLVKVLCMGNYNNTVFAKCIKLSTLQLKIFGNYSIVLQDSPLITYDSFKYIIDNAKNTAAITITVHPNSYAYLQGTTAPIDAVGGTTEQWKALVTAATAKQISFAEGTPTT